MTNNEIELTKIILQSENPVQAIGVAIGVIASLSGQHESSQEPFVELIQEAG